MTLEKLDTIRERIIDAWLASVLPEKVTLSDVQRTEVHRISHAVNAASASASSGVAHDTIRQRRKHLYAKTGADGADEIQAGLLLTAIERIAELEAAAAQAAERLEASRANEAKAREERDRCLVAHGEAQETRP